MAVKLTGTGLVTAVVLLLLAAAATEAQRVGDRAQTVGVLWPLATESFDRNPAAHALRQGLAEAGYVAGRNVVILVRATEGDDKLLPTVVTELVAREPDVIVTLGELPAQTLIRATSTIPIIVMAVGDPVGTGLVKSLTKPGGNVTAIVHIAPELSAKRLELLKELAPRARRVAMLLNPTNPHNALQWRGTQAGASLLGIQAYSVSIRTPEDVTRAFAEIATRGADGLLVAADNLLFNVRERIVGQALESRLPAVYPDRSIPDAGGLMSYGPNFTEIYRQAGAYAGKILGGAKIGDLPVQQPTRFELVINQRTARALGVIIPASLLLRADHVIDR